MKIRTFIRLMGIGAIGGVAYVHTQRRGEWTVASIKDTLNYLKRSMVSRPMSAWPDSKALIERCT